MKVTSLLSRVILAALIAGSIMLSGCASIINGSNQSVRVTSRPSGASIRVDDKDAGRTPTTLTLTRKTSHLVEITLNGYRRYEVTLEPSFNSATLGNVLAGGIVGMAVDSSSGASNTLTPDHIDAVLQKK